MTVARLKASLLHVLLASRPMFQEFNLKHNDVFMKDSMKLSVRPSPDKCSITVTVHVPL